MRFSLRDIVSFFVDFERALSMDAPPGVMEATPRDVEKLLLLFKGYSNCEFKPLGLDFSEGLPHPRGGAAPSNIRPYQVGSLIFNFGSHAEIFVNTMKNNDGYVIVNYCHRRFFTIKEAFHVILRDEFMRSGVGHPDTSSPEQLQTLIETMIYLPFSIVDFDDVDLKYPEAERIEHAAELLAIMMLYPLDRIAKDRQDFIKLVGATSFEDDTIKLANTFVYADTFKVPQRYVDLLFRWQKFDELYNIYCLKRDG